MHCLAFASESRGGLEAWGQVSEVTPKGWGHGRQRGGEEQCDWGEEGRLGDLPGRQDNVVVTQEHEVTCLSVKSLPFTGCRTWISP